MPIRNLGWTLVAWIVLARSISDPVTAFTNIQHHTVNLFVPKRQISYCCQTRTTMCIRENMHPIKGEAELTKSHRIGKFDSVGDSESQIDQMWDEAFSDEEERPDARQCSLEGSESKGFPNLLNVLAHRALRQRPLKLVCDKKRTLSWQLPSKEIKKHYPILNEMFLKSPVRWLRGERRLVQIIRTSALPKYSDEDENVTTSDAAARARFELGKRYSIKGIAGYGAFASVGWGVSVATGEELAFKRVPDVLPDCVAARRLMREVSLLRRVRGHPNILSIKDLIIRRRDVTTRDGALRRVTDVYLISEYMPADLCTMLDSGFVFSEEQIASIMWQLLRALRHLHACGVVHRDLKPRNVLISKFWHLVLCDLGIARSIHDPPTLSPTAPAPGVAGDDDESADRRFTDYVVTRPYRAPELLMGSHAYGGAVDMWSAGCLLAELLAALAPPEGAVLTRNTTAGPERLPLFPGDDHRDMIRRIVGLLGHPTPDVLDRIAAWEPQARAFVDRLPYPTCDLVTRAENIPVEVPAAAAPYCRLPPLPGVEGADDGVEWAAVFSGASGAAVDLLSRLLVYDPARRLTAEEALEHPLFRGAAGAASEREADLAMRRACVRSKASWGYFWIKRDRLHNRPH